MSERIINLYSILAVTTDGVMGTTKTDKDGNVTHGLPWEFGTQKADMKRFRELTKDNIVVMGWNTWESLNKKPLPKRMNIVLTRKRIQDSPDGVFFDEPSDLYSYLKSLTEQNPDKKVFIIGGESVYKQVSSWVEKLYLTEIHGFNAKDSGELKYVRFKNYIDELSINKDVQNYKSVTKVIKEPDTDNHKYAVFSDYNFVESSCPAPQPPLG